MTPSRAGCAALLLLAATPVQAAPYAYVEVDVTGSAKTAPVSIAADNGQGGSGSADLSTGSLHASAISGSAPSGNNYNAGANTNLQELLHVTGAIAKPVVVTITARLVGQLVGSMQPTTATTARVGFGVGVESASFDPVSYSPSNVQTTWQVGIYVNDRLPSGQSCPSRRTDSANYHEVTDCRLGAGEYDITYAMPLTITDTARDIALSAYLDADAFDGGQSLFGDTGAFGITLPDGLSYTSNSGAFQSSPEAFAVPEPGTLALLLGPLALLWGARRLRYPKAPTSCVTAVAISRTRANITRIGTITSACSRA